MADHLSIIESMMSITRKSTLKNICSLTLHRMGNLSSIMASEVGARTCALNLERSPAAAPLAQVAPEERSLSFSLIRSYDSTHSFQRTHQAGCCHLLSSRSGLQQVCVRPITSDVRLQSKDETNRSIHPVRLTATF